MTPRKHRSNLHLAAFQELEEAFGMLLFLVGRLFENLGNLHKAIFFAWPAK